MFDANESRISDRAPKHGIEPEAPLAVAEIESGGNAFAVAESKQDRLGGGLIFVPVINPSGSFDDPSLQGCFAGALAGKSN